jgi:transposase-like protein
VSPTCPHCSRDDDVELVAPFGGQLITAQWRCNNCRSYFEAVREDLAAETPLGAVPPLRPDGDRDP